MIEAEISKEFKEKVFDQRIIKEFSKAQVIIIIYAILNKLAYMLKMTMHHLSYRT